VLTFLASALILPGAGGAADAPALREQARRLAERERSAVLSLYALESSLSRARAALADARARHAAAVSERAAVARRVAIADRALDASHEELSQLLRTLYEHGDLDPLAIVLGARSLDEALTGLDSLSRAADQHRRVIAQTRTARARLQALSRRLAAQTRRLAAVERRAAAAATRLASAVAERARYVASLRQERAVTQRRLEALLAQARAAEERSARLAAAPVATASTTPGDAAEGAAPAVPEPVPGARTITVVATGYSLPGQTASGLPVGWGVVAVDPSVIPLGTRIVVPGYGEAVAADVGPAVRGAEIDLWFPSVAQARAWGVRTVTITVG
jgi:3D (Asp-Asp-Asp) domain-containing protein